MMPLENQQISRMTSKGQVLLHKSVRDRLGIGPGAELRVGTNDHGQAIIEPVHPWSTDPDERGMRFDAAIAKWAGKYATGKSTDEQMRELRGDPEL
jgi:bifunctional DNA-binding transcriptional regulator/antitoxin component of YhaV-PrlF toxin-antitoxin module